MDVLNQMLGGGQQRQEYEDFVSRYEHGAPWDNISDEEAVNRYNQVASKLPKDEYERVAQQSFEQLTPQQRREFAEFLRQRASRSGVDFQGVDDDGEADDPRRLARMAGRVHEKQPDMLSGLLTGGLGSMLGGGGGNRGGSDLLSSPIAKAALSGVAAYAAKKFMSGRWAPPLLNIPT